MIAEGCLEGISGIVVGRCERARRWALAALAIGMEARKGRDSERGSVRSTTTRDAHDPSVHEKTRSDQAESLNHVTRRPVRRALREGRSVAKCAISRAWDGNSPSVAGWTTAASRWRGPHPTRRRPDRERSESTRNLGQQREVGVGGFNGRAVATRAGGNDHIRCRYGDAPCPYLPGEIVRMPRRSGRR